MTRLETRYCPMNRAKCTGKLCALTSWRKSGVVTSNSGNVPQVTEWICDMSDRVVERE
jgi:hypothetical protein